MVYLSLPAALSALPEQGAVAAGSAEFKAVDHQTLQIHTSDKAIINYPAFNIAQGEHVEFVQPSQKSAVLNRVVGKNPSKILGQLSGNGKVFLVNPEGIYFGPHAEVNVGSFVASTLNIRDEDFLSETYNFFLEPGSKGAKILNEGVIRARPEGFIALMSPVVQNMGSIIARAEKIVLASGERVTLDFAGDGLLKFTVDGEIKDALIENFGKIDASLGMVSLSMPAAKQAIKTVVNMDGIETATEIVEEMGMIRLVGGSEIVSKKTEVDGSRVEVSGLVIGEDVQILGDDIFLKAGKIDVSQAGGGGTVNVGGSFQGKGPLRGSYRTLMHADAAIAADATVKGDGGTVILWSDGLTFFDGQIFARGGPEGGNGGFVETSGKQNLGSQFGRVHIEAPYGKAGEHLLDPASVIIATGGGATLAQVTAPNCATAGIFTIDPSMFTGSAGTVSICSQNAAGSSITVNSAVAMTSVGAGLTLTAGSGSAGAITLTKNITTKGGPITLNGAVALSLGVALDTTNAGGTPAGSNIIFSSTVDGPGNLTLTAGTGGNITFTGAAGASTSLGTLTINSAAQVQAGNISCYYLAQTSPIPTLNYLGNIDTTGPTVSTFTGGAITITGNLISSANGYTITNSGLLTLTLGASTNITESFLQQGGGAVHLSGTLAASGASVTFTNAVTLTNPATVSASIITFMSTIDGAQTLALNPINSLTLSGAVGGAAPLTNLTFGVPNQINIGNNITMSGANPLTFPAASPVVLTGPSIITSNNANVNFNRTIDGAQALTINAGTGAITLSGAVGGSTPLGALSLTSTNATGVTIGNNITAASFTTTGTTTAFLSGPSTISTSASNGAISFGGTIDGTQALTLTAGSGQITLSQVVGGTTPLGAMSLTTTNATGVMISNNITASSFTTTSSTNVSLGGSFAINTSASNGAISFGGGINGADALSLVAGTGVITLSGAVGGTAPLTNLAFTSASQINLGGNITITGANPLTFPDPVSMTGPSIITSNNQSVSFNSTINGAQALTINAGTGAITLSGVVGGTTPVGAISLTSSNAVGVTITNNITASAFATAGTTKTLLTKSGVTTIDTSAANGAISFGGTIDANSTGADGLTLTAGSGPITLSGVVGGVKRLGDVSLTTTNSTGATISANIAANSFATTGTTKVFLGGPVTINTSVNSNFISFGGAIDGAQTLTLAAGTAAITLSGAVGGTTPLTNLTFTSASQINIGSNITVTGANPLTFPAGQPVVLTGSSIITSNNASVSFGSTINGTTARTQALTVAGGSGQITFSGIVGGTTPLGAISLTTTNATGVSISNNITASSFTTTGTTKVSLGGSFAINTSAGNGAISFGGAIDGADALSLAAGTGAITLSGAVGGATPLTNLTFTSASLINIGNNITVTGANPLTFPDPVSITGPSVITSNNQSVSFNSTINGTHPLTVAAGTGAITLSGVVGGSTRLGAISLTSTNATGVTIGANITANSLTTTGTTSTLLTLAGTTTIDASTVSGGISFGGTIDGSVAGAQALTLTAGSGAITLSGVVGGSTRLGAMSLTTTNATGVTIGANITANSFTATGTTKTFLSGPSIIDTSANNGAISFGGTINGTQALTLTAGSGAITLSGVVGGSTRLGAMSLTTTNATGVSIGANITANSFTTTGTTKTLLTLAGTTTIDTSANNGAISFGGTIDGSSAGAQALTLTAGSGPITLTGIVGGTTRLGALNLTTTNATGATIGANITANSFAATATTNTFLSGPVVINTSSDNGAISFGGTVDGAQNLTLNAGSGTITFTGAVGGGTRLGALTITNVGSLTANNITAGSITQTAGSGTTTFNGLLNTNLVAGITLTGTTFNINNNVTTTNGGPLTVTHSGTLTIGCAVTLSLAGGFFDNGPGPTSFGSSITTSGTNLTFSAPLVLTCPTTTISTGAGVGNILFNSTITGAGKNLTLTAGGGNITFQADVGTLANPIGVLTVNAVNNVTANGALYTSQYNQTSVAGTGTTAFNGLVDITSGAGLAATTNNVTFNNTVTTASGGTVTATVGSTLTLTSAAALNLDGAFLQNGAGGVQSAGSITTTNDNIQFTGPVSLTGLTTLNTGAGIGDILFSSTVDGPGGLTLTAGTGNITFSGAVGATTRLGAMTINTATQVQAGNIKAASLAQTGPVATSNYLGYINTNGASGVNLAGAAMTITGDLITTSGGPFAITNSGLLTLTAGANTSISGAFSQQGGGTVSFSGPLVTTNQTITFTNNVTLTGSATFNSGTGSVGNITFMGTIDGAQTLALSSGAANISLQGNVGSGTRLGAVTINQAATVTTLGIQAASLTQQNGTVLSTFNGAINTNTLAGVSLTGAGFTINGGVTTTAAGPLVIANTGTATVASNCSLGGAFTQNGTGPMTLSAQITAGDVVSIAQALTVSGTASITTAAASKNITISKTIDGGGALTLASGGADILVSGAIGGGTRLGALTFGAARNVTTVGIKAASILQSPAGTGTTTLTGNLDTNAGGVTLNVATLANNGTVTTVGGGVTITNSGQMTSVFGSGTSIGGAYLQNGAGLVSIEGTVATTNQSITFLNPASAITLTNDLSLNTGTTGGNIQIHGTINGAHALTLNGGTGGSITLFSAVGGVAPALTSVAITNAFDVTTQAITAGSIAQSAGQDLTTFNGALTTSTAGGVSLTGTGFQIANGVTTGDSGPFTLVNSGLATLGPTAFSIGGAFAESGSGTVSLGANITTTGGGISFGAATTLTGGISLNSSAGNGNILFSNTLNGAQTLSLTAGGGNVTFSAAVGAVTPLTTLTVVSAANITAANIGTSLAQGVTGATTLPATANLNFSGTTYNLGTQTLSATTVNFNAGALTTFTTNGNPITFTATTMQLAASTDLTINSGGGAITIPTLRAVTGNLRSVSLNAGTAAVQVGQIGSAGNSEFSSASLSGGNLLIRGDIFANTLTLTSSAGHQIFLGGNITTANTVTFPVAVVRDTIATATVTTGGGGITFSSTVDGDAPLTRNLTLAAGSGTISLVGAVGGIQPFNTFTIASAGNATASSAITAGALVQSSGTGTTTFNGTVSTSSAAGINLAGAGFTFNNTVTTTGGGGLAVNNSGVLSMPFGANATLNGAFSQTGAGAVQIGDIIAADNQALFTGPVYVTNNAAEVTTASFSHLITFNSTVDSISSTPINFTLNSGTSNITILGNIGSTFPLGVATIVNCQNITVEGIIANQAVITSGTGTATINGNAIIGSGGLQVTGNNFVKNGNVTTTGGGNFVLNNSGTATGEAGLTTISGNYSQIGTGPYFSAGLSTIGGNLLITSAVTLFADTIFDLSGGTGTIHFMSTIDGTVGPVALTLKSGGNTVNLDGNIGSLVPMGALTISGATNVTTASIQAASITETGGTGTTTFSGALSTSGAAGISVAANAIIRGAAITTTGGGGITITNNGGAFTSTAAGDITSSGAFNQNGSGPVSLAGNVTTSNANLSFSSPITMTNTVSLSTGTGTGAITLSQTVQGAFGLTLNSGAGSITIGGAVGTALTPLAGFTITQAGTVSTQAITSTFITQAGGSGITTFNGALHSTMGSGISLSGTGFAFFGTITTDAGGNLAITNTGANTFHAGATGAIGGSFTQTGTGSTQLSSAITAGGAMQFAGAFTVSGTGSLDTSAANQPITFSSTLDGPGDLTLATGTADILIQGNAGLLSSLGNVTITTARNVTAQALTATSLLQSNGTGTTLFNGAINAAGAITLNGSAFTFLQNVTTTAGGAVHITNTGTLTTTAGKMISSNGTFTQDGSGSVLLGTNITTTNAVKANAGINFTGTSAITLTAPVTLDTSIGGGMITVGAMSPIDGNQPLTLTAGLSGNVSIGSAIGGVTRIGAFTITSTNNLDVLAIKASSISQLSSSLTGTSTLNGVLDTNGPTGMAFIGANFTLGLGATSITTTNGGSITLTNSGLVSSAGGATTITIDNAFIQNGTGPVFVGSVTTLHGGISYTGPAIVPALAVLDSSAGNGNITFSNTVDGLVGGESLTFKAGTGDIMFGDVVGAGHPLGTVTITSGDEFTATTLSAASITGTLTGQAIFGGTVTTSAAGGIALTAQAMTFNNVTTTGTGVVTLTNGGLLTIASGSAFNLDGAFTQNGAGSVSLGGSITTTNDAISFATPIVLTATSALNTGAGLGNITLSSSVDGAQALTLTSGMGNIDVQGTIGHTNPLTALTVASAATVLVNNDAIVAGPFTITSATGTSTFNGILKATSINLASVAAVNFNKAVTSTTGAIAIHNSGALTVASTAPITAQTSFSQTSGVATTVSLGANIITGGPLPANVGAGTDINIFSPLTLTSSLLLDSQGGNITISDTVSGAFDLTLTAGAGDITLSGAIDGPRIGNFTITSAHNVTANAITAASISQQSGTGTTLLQGALDTNTINGISLVGQAFTSSAGITASFGGSMTVTNSGLFTRTAASIISLTGGGSFNQNGTGLVDLGGTITTQGGNISHAGPVDVLLMSTCTSNNGNIVFSNTVDGPACLITTAGTGTVEFDGAVGSTTPLGCLTASGATILQGSTLQSTGAVSETGTTTIHVGGGITTTTGGAGITLTGNVVMTATNTLATNNGTISITGTVDGDVAGRNLNIQAGSGDISIGGTTGGNTPFHNLTMNANNISWANLGTTSIGATGTTTLTATTNINFNGTSYNNGTQNYTAGSDFNFTPAATINSNALPITFMTGVIHLTSGNDLTINSNGGAITMGDLIVDSLVAMGPNLTLNAAAGTITAGKIASTSPSMCVGNELYNATLTSGPPPSYTILCYSHTLTVNTSSLVMISGNVSSPGVALIYNAPVQVTADNITFSTCAGGADIIFNSTFDADVAGNNRNVTFETCGHRLIFNGPVGSIAPLTSITAGSVANPNVSDMEINSTMNVGALTVRNSTGTTTAASGITSTGSGGVHLTGVVMNLTGSFTTASTGPFVLANSGALTVSPGSSFNTSGAFQQTGAGSVSIGANVVTNNTAISFAGPVTLTGTTTLNSNATTGGAISFASTLDGTLAGAQNLTLASGGQDITFTGIVGMMTPLGNLQITNAGNVTSSTISAATISQLAGTGTTSFGALTTTGLNGINLTGSAFTFNNNVTTTPSGPLIINNAGALTLASATYSIGGALTQSGAGTSTIAGNFTAGGQVSFAQGVTLSGATTFDTSANSQNILFSSTLTNDMMGAHSLSLNAGSGSITFTGTVGATPIGALTITNAATVTSGAISAATISSNAVTTNVSGNLTTTGGAGISLTGTNFMINSTVTTTGTGPFSITNSGPLSLTLGSLTSVAGSFTQGGGGAVTLAGTLLTNDNPISFANPITLSGNTSLSSGTGVAGGITLSSTVNGNFNLTLAADMSNIVFGSTLGQSTPLGTLTVSSVNNITYPPTSAHTIVQTGASGTTTITGPLSATVAGVSISGGTINQNGAISTSAGSVAFINTGVLTVSAATTATGGYSQSGVGGTVHLGAPISSVNNLISIAGATTLTSDVAISTGPVNGDITFGSTVDGAHALTLNAVGGSITLGGTVGTVALTAVNITKALNVSTQAISAGALTQSAGTGTTTFNGALTIGASGISLTGASFAFNSPVTTTGAGNLLITNTGVAAFNAGASVSNITGFFTQTGTGSVQLSCAITGSKAMQFAGPFTVSGTGSLDTHAANQPITFLSTLNGVGGAGDLTLATGTAAILIDGNAGLLSSLGNVTITTAGNVTAQALTAASLIQSNGTGTTLFNGAVNAAGAITLNGSAFTFLQNVTTTTGGAVHITNTGTLTTTAGKMISSNGNFTQDGSGSVLLGTNITTTNAMAANANINFTGTSAITLTAPVTLDTSAGGGMITVGAMSPIDGNQPLTVTAGSSGNVEIDSAIGNGTRIGAFTITSTHNLTVNKIFASSINQMAGSGTSILNGILNTNGPAGMTFTGINFTLGAGATSITTTNGGSITLTNSGLVSSAGGATTITIDNAFIQNGTGPVFVGSVTTLHGGISYTGAAYVPAPAVLDSSAGNGNIIFSSTVDGLLGAGSLTLTPGSGNATFSSPIGSTPFPMQTPLVSLTVTAGTVSVNNIGTSLAAGVSGTTTLTASQNINFTGTTYNVNAMNNTATTQFNMNSGALTTFSSGGSTMTFSGGSILLSTGTDLTMNTGGSSLTLGAIHAQAGNHRHLVLNTVAGMGSIQVGDLGTAGNGEFASASFNCLNLILGNEYADTFTFDYTGTLYTMGNIGSTDTALSFPNPVVLMNSGTYSTVALMGADITFSSTVDGFVDDIFVLTLNAGFGSVNFNANVGVGHRPAGLTILSALDVNLPNPLTTMIVDSLTQFSGFGTTTFTGALIVPSFAGISLTGTNFTFNNVVETVPFSNGPMIVNNSGTLTFAGLGNISGGFTQNGTTSHVTLSGSITAGQPILFQGLVALTGNPVLDTSAANQTITFQNTINGSGALTLASGTTGDINLLANCGLTSRLGALTVASSHNFTAQAISAASASISSSATGTVTLNGTLNTNGGAGITFTGNAYVFNAALVTTNLGSVVLTNSGLATTSGQYSSSVDGSFTQNGTGPVNIQGTLATLHGPISFATPVTLLAASSFDSSAANQNTTFTSTVDGPGSLSVRTGNGDITFMMDLGDAAPIGAIMIPVARNVTTQKVTAASFTQTSASLTGTTIFNGDLITSAAAGISLSGHNFTRGANWTTTHTGTITVNNGGLFTSTAAGTISADGAFSQSGGTVSISGPVITNNASLSFAGPITLVGATSFNSGTGLGPILIASTVDGTAPGAQNLSITSGLDDTTFQAAVGAGTRLGTLDIAVARNATFNGLTTAALTQQSGTGTTTLNGTTNINTITGIQLVTNAITLNNTLTTTAAGPVLLSNAGLLTVAATCNVSGNFTQNGLGASTISGSVTSGGAIFFNKGVSTTGSPSLTTTSQPITFSTTLDGPGDLSITSNASDIICLGNAGTTISRLGNLVFNAAANISMKAITAASIKQSVASTGQTTLIGDLNTNTLTGILLNGVGTTITGSIITTALGPCSIHHTGNLNLTAGPNTLISGSFTETGSAPVFLSGLVHANTNNISFANIINLVGTTTLNSDGGGDITISSAVNGPNDLILTALE